MLMLYFAYGSNMHAGQMKERCPSATFLCRAKLPAHRLAFTLRSCRRGCGVADILRDEAKDVWGGFTSFQRVTWKISIKTKTLAPDGLIFRTSTLAKIVTYGSRVMRNGCFSSHSIAAIRSPIRLCLIAITRA
jgi:hypothetical protein